MFKFIKKSILLLLVLCLLQSVFVPQAATAASSAPVVYDFYTPYKSYSYLYHWRSEAELNGQTIARKQISSDFANGKSNWDMELTSGYATIKGSYAHIAVKMGQAAYFAVRIKSPGTGNYEVNVNYATTNSEISNVAAEFLIVPAEKASYTSQEISDLAAQNRTQARVSCYDASASYKNKTATISCSFLEGQEYLFIVRGGPASSGNSQSDTYLRNLTAKWVGEYNPPEESEYPRPITILEEALTRWEDDFSIVAEVNGDDYFALPIYGGKMYIFNLDTWQLADTVNTGIGVPRGITVDDEGVIYLVGDSYHIYKYDLKTNKASKSTNVNISGVVLGSLYDIHYGEDGYLYTGTDNGHIIRYNPNTDTVTAIMPADYGISGATYVSSVLQQGQYIYAAVTTSASKHYVVKLDKDTFEVMDTADYTSTRPATYMSYMSITSDGIILGTANNLMAVDSETMTLLTANQLGTSARAQCYVSEEINGKHYFVSSTDRYLYRYDPNAEDGNKVTKMSAVGQFLDCQGKTVTFDKDRDGKDETYLLAMESPKTYPINFVNVETGAVWQRSIGSLLDENAGASTGVNALTSGPVGSNELYFGGFTSNQVIVYNTAEGKITSQITASGIQTDAICVDGNTIYAGNYTEAQLTRLNRTTNKPEVLFTLHNSLFNQSRIHSIVAGDNKVFLGTFPYVYKHGGVLAWYDFNEELTYVAAGPNPEDVYYAKTYDSQKNKPVDSPVWFNEVTGKQVTSLTVTGVVTNQGIKDVAYHNGILYAATSRTGGTNTSPVAGTSAVIIAYDVAAKKVIATFDPAQYGFTSPVPMVSGIEMDENGTLWGVVSETLFTLTLNANNTFTYNQKLSFDKYAYDATQNRTNSDIRFKDGYVYAAFERVGGLCKVNMANPSDYTMLLPNVTSNSQVPESFALGEDGNLYCLMGASLEMLTLDPTEAEWTEARKVTEQISAITPDTISAVRQAYEQLTLRQKSLVQNYDVLVQAEADALMEEIDALGVITWGKREQVQTLLDIYKQMPKSQQNKVTNYYVLANANQQLQRLQRNAPVAVENAAGELSHYQSLEEALAKTTSGTVYLLRDVTAGTVILKSGITLDLGGNTLTADYLVAMNGATVLDCGTECTGGGLLKIKKENLALSKNNGNGVIAVWNGTDGYLFTRVTFLQMANPVDVGVAQYIFLPRLSNAAAAALLADGGLDNGLKIQVSLTWNNGQSQQFYTYSDELVQKVFDGTNRWVFDLKVTGIDGITDMVANPVVVTDCGAKATADDTQIKGKTFPSELEGAMGYMLLP